MTGDELFALLDYARAESYLELPYSESLRTAMETSNVEIIEDDDGLGLRFTDPSGVGFRVEWRSGLPESEGETP